MRYKPTNAAKYCLVIFLFSFPFIANAQGNEKLLSKLYFQAAAGASSRAGSNTELSLQGLIHKKWSFTLSKHDLSMEPKNLPSDYVPETGSFLVIPYTNHITVDMQIFSVTAGKFIKLGRNTWLSPEAGISLVNGQTASFQKREREENSFLFFSWISSNYYNTIEKKTAVGAMLRADFNWAFCRYIGLGAGVFANFNSIQSPVGLNLKLTVGAMGREKKVKARKVSH